MNSLNFKHQGKSSNGISPVSLHAFMKTLKTNISEAQKVQIDCLNNLESDSYDKNDMQRKCMSWLGYTREFKKNLKQRHIPIQSKLLPWYLINGLECTA